MALDATALIALADAKNELGITVNTEDAWIEDLINRASIWIETQTGRRVFKSRAITNEYQDGHGTSFLYLDWVPASAITDLRVDSARQFSASTVLTPWDEATATGYYMLDGDIGEVFRADGGTFPNLRRCVKVSYTAGAAAVPKDIQQACILMVAYWYDLGATVTAGGAVKSETVGSYSVAYTEDSVAISDNVKSALDPIIDAYRVPPMGVFG